MRSHGLNAPAISPFAVKAFSIYLHWYLYRNLHAVRLSHQSARPELLDRPAIVCMNHPGWWDPLLALFLSHKLFPERLHYGPIESKALSRYQFFEKIGFFGIDPHTAAGASRFLRTGEAILKLPNGTLWVTGQGEFIDARSRPVRIRGGIGHLVKRMQNVLVVPLALEYPFWEEKYAEALARFGQPIVVDDGRQRSADEWTALISAKLEETQDLLAAEAIARRPEDFERLLGGRAGVGGIYDLWRSFRARVRGQRFEGAHGVDQA